MPERREVEVYCNVWQGAEAEEQLESMRTEMQALQRELERVQAEASRAAQIHEQASICLTMLSCIPVHSSTLPWVCKELSTVYLGLLRSQGAGWSLAARPSQQVHVWKSNIITKLHLAAG